MTEKFVNKEYTSKLSWTDLTSVERSLAMELIKEIDVLCHTSSGKKQKLTIEDGLRAMIDGLRMAK